MGTVIQTEHISKNFGKLRAVKDISLEVGRGEIYGLIGLNGAGKTTLFRMLLGMIRPTGGTVYINGKKIRPGEHNIWKDVGYIIETPHSYPELTVRENLEISRRLRLIPQQKSVESVIHRLNLKEHAWKKAKHLSTGNAQRLGIAKAILAMPEILILDEPVNGLDPAGVVEIRNLLRELALDRGVTILISSHILSEMAKTATKIGIIHGGELLQEMDSKKLCKLFKSYLIVACRDNELALSKLASAGYSPSLNR